MAERVTLRICAGEDALAAAAAEEVVHASRSALEKGGSFRFVLSGGQSPKRAYALLAKTPFRDAIDWRRAFLFWGDERCVPSADPRSNYGEAHRLLLASVGVPADQIFPIHGELPAAAAAADYERRLRAHFGVDAPEFDLVFLGLGADGHVASLFPEMPELLDSTCWAVPSRKPGEELGRVSLTPLLLRRARKTVFLVAGEEKGEALRDALEPGGDASAPSRRARSEAGETLWLIDPEAFGEAQGRILA